MCTTQFDVRLTRAHSGMAKSARKLAETIDVLHKTLDSGGALNKGIRIHIPLCNTLQYAATHRDALQQTATRCNTLQHNTQGPVEVATALVP